MSEENKAPKADRASDANQVQVKATAYFRGQPGEGKNKDGNVAPGDDISVSRQRAAELNANGLIEGFKPTEADQEVKPHSGSSIAIDPATAKAAADEAQRASGATVIVNDKRKQTGGKTGV